MPEAKIFISELLLPSSMIEAKAVDVVVLTRPHTPPASQRASIWVPFVPSRILVFIVTFP